MDRWVGLGVIGDTLINIDHAIVAMEEAAAP
jgi:hypothetical protein